MRTHYYLAFLCLFIAHLSLAQNFRPGYVKLKDGQDQHGLIGKVIQGYPERIEYKADSASQIVRYPANEVLGYGIDNGTYFSSFQEPGAAMGWNFAEIFVEGELTLIQRNNFFFLIDRKAGKIVHLDNKYKARLRSMMAGCPVVGGRSVKVSKNVEELSAHVKAYNECVRSRNPNLDGVRRPVSIAAMVGYDNSSAKFTEPSDLGTSRYLTGGTLNDNSFLQGGIDFTFRKYEFSSTFALYGGVFYNSNSYSQSNKITTPTHTEYNRYTIDFKQIKIPVGIEILKPSLSKLQVHGRIGATFSQTMNLTSTRVYNVDVKSDGNIYAEMAPTLMEFKIKPMLTVAIGLDYRIAEKQQLRLQLSYSHGTVTAVTGTSPQDDTIDGKLTSLNAMLGFIF